MTTWQFEALAVAALVAFVAVLAVRTVLVERAAGVGRRAAPAWSRPRVVRHLDLVAVLLAVLCTGVLVTTVVVGALSGV